jgi:outer membrane receptor for ferric coprogen and ferric-rhodotorulic acid
MKPTFPAPLRLVAVAALLAVAGPALAQSARATPAPDAGAAAAATDAGLLAAADGTQRVTITGAADDGYGARVSNAATGLDLSLRETPQSISVISRQQMDDFALTNINDVLALTPGVSVQSVETDRTYYSARGFDITNFQVDGIGMPFSNGSQWGDLDTFFFERVDVVRGANGLMSSTGNPSATVDFVRKRPTREFESSAALTLGSWNDRRLEGDVGGALVASGTVRGRVLAFGEQADSYLDRYSKDTRGVAALVDVDLAPRTTFTAGYQQQASDADSPMWGALPLTYTDGTPTHYDISTSTAADWSWWNNTDRRGFAEVRYDAGNGWLAKAGVTRRTFGANSELFYVFGHPDPVTQVGPMSYPSAFGGEYDQTLVDLRLGGPFTMFGRTHSVTFGADWARENAFETSGYGPADSIGVVLPPLDTWDGSFPKPDFDVSHAGSKWRTVRRSVFAATHLNLADAFNVVAGANATGISTSGTSYGVDHACDRAAVTPYLGAVADLGPATSAYASYTRIFNPQTEIGADLQPLDPIEGSSVEAGLKSEWLNQKLLGAFAVFRTRQDNTAVPDPGTFNPTTYHGEDAISTGFEAQVTGRAAPGWDVSAGYTQLTSLKHPDGTPANTYVPRRTLQLATTYRLPVLPALKVGGTLRWQEDIYTVDDNAAIVRQPAYAVVGLMASYDIAPHWSASVNVNNVTDDKHYASLYWTQAYYAPPRQVTATLRWTY